MKPTTASRRDVRSRPAPEGARWAIVAPLAVEAAAVRGAAPGALVVRPGTLPRASGLPVAVIAGVAGGLARDLAPGDVIVADEVRRQAQPRRAARIVALPAAERLAAVLTRHGIAVRVGPVVTAARIVRGRARRSMAGGGALAVDLESADLLDELAGSGGPVSAVVRVVVDTAERELWRPSTLVGGVRALRRLRALRPALAAWAEDEVRALEAPRTDRPPTDDPAQRPSGPSRLGAEARRGSDQSAAFAPSGAQPRMEVS